MLLLEKSQARDGVYLLLLKHSQIGFIKSRFLPSVPVLFHVWFHSQHFHTQHCHTVQQQTLQSCNPACIVVTETQKGPGGFPLGTRGARIFIDLRAADAP